MVLLNLLLKLLRDYFWSYCTELLGETEANFLLIVIFPILNESLINMELINITIDNLLEKYNFITTDQNVG